MYAFFLSNYHLSVVNLHAHTHTHIDRWTVEFKWSKKKNWNNKHLFLWRKKQRSYLSNRCSTSITSLLLEHLLVYFTIIIIHTHTHTRTNKQKKHNPLVKKRRIWKSTMSVWMNEWINGWKIPEFLTFFLHIINDITYYVNECVSGHYTHIFYYYYYREHYKFWYFI